MYPGLFSEETPGSSFRVSDHLPEATTKSSPFGWSLTGGLTVIQPRYLLERRIICV